jgi:hypothetical protein
MECRLAGTQYGDDRSLSTVGGQADPDYETARKIARFLHPGYSKHEETSDE